ALNTNKIYIIPALVNKETSSVARSDIDKAYLLAKTFAEPPQPPKDVDEKHYEMIEDDIRFKVAISKSLELNDNFIGVSDTHQSNITKEEVIEAMRHLSPYKAQGPDNIHNQRLKNGGNAMIESLVFLFGWSFRMGYIPIAWKKANIVPIPKPDRDHSQCKNHRPIALLSSVGKLMERIITRRLMWWIPIMA
ncbi:hypothetical protein RFI_37004, partial [Reticulomyxa filosa]